MGIQDRDYYHDKRYSEKVTSGRKTTAGTLPELSCRYLFKTILIWVPLTLIFLAIFDYYNPLQQTYFQDAGNVPSAIAKPRKCESLPPHGSAYMLDPSTMKRANVLYSGLEIENKYDQPMVILLSDPIGSKRLLALSIASNKAAKVTVPIGQYGMQVLLGSEWCNLETGFSDGAKVTVVDGLSVKTGATTVMQFTGSGLRPVQLALAYNLSRPIAPQHEKQSSEVFGNGRLDLLQTHDGHYYSSGAVNGVPVVFMIDTEATTVSVSTEIASLAGIQQCSSQLIATTNNNVNACKTTAPEVTFGKFRLTDVEVTIMPNMSGNALLGLNVLRNFHIEQTGKVMKISAR